MSGNVRQLPVRGRADDKSAAAAVDLDDDDDDDDECPKCPPVGAPAWLATFADIATNLMAFFVLILGFAKFDEPSFAKMAGSMRDTFGFTAMTPISENSGPPNVIQFDFQSGQDAKGIEAPVKPEETDPAGNKEPGKPDGSDQQGSAGDAMKDAAAEQARAAGEALLKALASGQLKIEQGDTSVTVRLPEGKDQPDAKALAEALASAAGGKVLDGTAKGDAAGGGKSPDATATDQPGAGPEPQPATGETALAEAEAGDGGKGGSQSGPGRSPGFAHAKLSVALEQEIANGLVTVERREGRVFVTVGEGGGFASGSTELTDEARALMGRIVASALSPDVSITVTGHTDDVAVGAGSPYVDNVGLGAARASAVVREFVGSGAVDPSRVSAVSKGDTMPIADNTTEEGRAKNRRIEIEIDYSTPAEAQAVAGP